MREASREEIKGFLPSANDSPTVSCINAEMSRKVLSDNGVAVALN